MCSRDLGLFTGWLVMCIVSLPIFGQDKVTVQTRDSAKPVILLGQVLDYTGAVLTIRLSNGTPQVVDASSVTGLETFYEPDHRDALKALAENDNTTARDKFESALKKEARTWVKREILAGLVRTYQRLGDPLTASTHFLEMTESDPVTRHWGIAPLLWGPAAVNSQMSQQARVWLAGDKDDARLLGASWLLLDPVYSEAAQVGLMRLTKGTNERLTTFARMQLWRLALAQNSVSDLTLQNWDDDLSRLPESMRAGPQFLRATAYWQSGDHNSAIAEYLKLPLVFTDHEPLTAKSLLLAAEGLQEGGLTREAQTLYLELTLRYAWAPEAKEARHRLNDLAHTPSPTPAP